MLKDLLTEEQARKLYCIAVWGDINSKIAYKNADYFVKLLKQADIIRKSPLAEARENTDELINNMSFYIYNNCGWMQKKDDIIKLIKVEREIADKKE